MKKTVMPKRPAHSNENTRPLGFIELNIKKSEGVLLMVDFFPFFLIFPFHIFCLGCLSGIVKQILQKQTSVLKSQQLHTKVFVISRLMFSLPFFLCFCL